VFVCEPRCFSRQIMYARSNSCSSLLIHSNKYLYRQNALVWGESEKTHFLLPVFVWNRKREMGKKISFHFSLLHYHFLTSRVL